MKKIHKFFQLNLIKGALPLERLNFPFPSVFDDANEKFFSIDDCVKRDENCYVKEKSRKTENFIEYFSHRKLRMCSTQKNSAFLLKSRAENINRILSSIQRNYHQDHQQEQENSSRQRSFVLESGILKYAIVLVVVSSLASLAYFIQMKKKQYDQERENAILEEEEEEDEEFKITRQEKSYEEIVNMLNGNIEQYSDASLIYRFYKSITFKISILFRVGRLLIRFVPLVLAYPLLVSYSPLDWTQELWYRWLLFCMKRSGPVFIKLGQWIGTRKDIFSDRLTNTLEELHSNGHYHSMEETKKIVCEEMKIKDLSEIFETFDEDPVGTGAIAQVYRGKLREEIIEEQKENDDEKAHNEEEFSQLHGDVAIKVRHPGIQNVLIKDLGILKVVVGVLQKFKKYSWLELDEKFIFFAKHLTQQLNLEMEAKNLLIFRHNFRKFPGVIFPKPYMDFCSEKVIVESFEKGIPIKELVQKKDNFGSRVRRRVARLGVVCFLKQMISDNFLHADLHPGNIFVRLDVDETKKQVQPSMILLDTGLVIELSKETRSKFFDVLEAVGKRQGERAALAFIKGTRHYKKYISEGKLDYSIMEKEDKKRIQDFIQTCRVLTCEMVDKPLGQSRVAPIFSEFLRVVRENRITLESDIVNVLIGIIIAEGFGKQLYEKVRFLAVAKQLLILSPEARREFYNHRFRTYLSKMDK